MGTVKQLNNTQTTSKVEINLSDATYRRMSISVGVCLHRKSVVERERERESAVRVKYILFFFCLDS